MTHLPPMTIPITRRLAASIALAALAATCHAHGPTRQKVVEKIGIDAPADKVWAKIQDFGALKDWHPAVAESAVPDSSPPPPSGTTMVTGRDG